MEKVSLRINEIKSLGKFIPGYDKITNHVIDGDKGTFEANITGWVTDGVSGIVLSHSNTSAYTGTYGLLATNIPQSEALIARHSTTIKLKKNTMYDLKARIKVSGYAGSFQGDHRIRFAINGFSDALLIQQQEYTSYWSGVYIEIHAKLRVGLDQTGRFEFRSFGRHVNEIGAALQVAFDDVSLREAVPPLVERFESGNFTEVDILNDIDTKVTYKLRDILQPGVNKAEIIKSITIPETASINRLFGPIHELSSGKGQKAMKTLFKANLFVDGYKIFDGVLRLDEALKNLKRNTGFYKGRLYGSIKNWIDLIGDAKICDLDLTDYNHIRNIENIKATWSLNGDTALYIYALFGNDDENFITYDDSLPVIHDVYKWQPSLVDKQLLKRIFENVGYRVEFKGEYCNSDFFRDQLTYWGSTLADDEELISSFQTFNPVGQDMNDIRFAISALNNVNGYITANSNYDVEFGHSEQNDDFDWIQDISVYKVPGYQLKIFIETEIAPNNSAVQPSPGVFGFPSGILNFDIPDDYDNTFVGVRMRLNTTIHNYVVNQDLLFPGIPQGQVVHMYGLYIEIYNKNGVIHSTTIFDNNEVNWNPVGTYYQIYNITNNADGTVTWAYRVEGVGSVLTYTFGVPKLKFAQSLYFGALPYGVNVDYSQCKSDYKQLDFLRLVAHQHNLIYNTNDELKLIEVWQRNDFYGNIATKAQDAKDITKKVHVEEIPEKLISSEYNRNLIFRYQNDSCAYIGEIETEDGPLTQESYDYGTRVRELDILNVGETVVIDLNASATAMKLFTDIFMPITSSENDSIKPRKLVWKGLKACAEFKYREYAYTYDNDTFYPYAYFYPNGANEIALSYYIPDGFNDIMDLYTKCYAEEVDIIENGRLLSPEAHITKLDINRLEYGRLLKFMNDYFILNGIINYDPMNESALTMIELISLKKYI